MCNWEFSKIPNITQIPKYSKIPNPILKNSMDQAFALPNPLKHPKFQIHIRLLKNSLDPDLCLTKSS